MGDQLVKATFAEFAAAAIEHGATIVKVSHGIVDLFGAAFGVRSLRWWMNTGYYEFNLKSKCGEAFTVPDLFAALFPPEPPKPDAHGWLPIEGAPKDGTNVLIAAEESGYRDVGYWCSMRRGWTTDNRQQSPELPRVTHWQPLPKPPVGA